MDNQEKDEKPVQVVSELNDRLGGPPKEEWFCPRYHETCQALVELEFANARVAELEEWRIGAVNRIAELKSQINHLTNDIAALRKHSA